ncbi:hypothetical protein JOD54_004788 [Actinokineospora baliensis]|uniref:hypothetical protein n=1 Tax=Actinokineospora baliensis TaxID=547056 RepID=UPI00195B6ED0|nr:hypothetical protein [Actinokineospora baliensis]MBM7774584.1 hypothetical protein [Actinokineospora baliensis]
MGVYFDYFRAPDVAVVLRGVSDRAAFPAFDGVSAKWFALDGAVDRLVGLAGHEVVERRVWPAGPEPDGPVAAGDPWLTGPFVYEWDAGTRDALALLSDVDGVARRWAREEELDEVDAVVAWVGALVRVARAARDADEVLFYSMAG